MKRERSGVQTLLHTRKVAEADTIQLRCSKAELEKMEPFIKTTFIEDSMPARNFENAGVAKGMGMGTNYYLPYVTFERTFQTPVEHQQIRRGNCLCAVVPA
jgi:hypothetical protein